MVTVRTALARLPRRPQEHGGSVNDVILATVTGALRGWLLGRAESMSGIKHVRTVVPVSVSDRELETTSLGSPIIAYFVDLPVGEASPVVRLHQVSYAFKAHKETGRGVAANRLAGIAGFAPSTFHAIGARVAADEARRGFQLSVTNVPGPQSPLFAAGARMLETYPVHPLLPGHALAIGVTSYDGHVFYGITADRDRIPDAEVLGQCVPEALAELLDTISGRTRAPRGRRAKKTSKRTAGPLMRVYQPSTLTELAAAYAAGSMRPDADAVVSESEAEEDEYAALMTAADISAARLAGLADGLRRRVVVVLEARATPADPGRARRSRQTTPIPTTTWRGTRPRSSTRSWAGSSDNIAGMDAISFPPAPVNEPNLTYAPGQL